ncbi:MAG: hypothetical protein JRG91_05610 [Deltaproteobacteria bacterium]|nr:hypothetical protein [Deltaproteobacteria bacterium]
MTVPRLLVLAGLLLPGCGSSRGLEGDASADASDPSTDDLLLLDHPEDPGVESDAGCDPEVHWTLQERTIHSVTLVDGIARVGVTQRYVVEVELRSGCEVLAGIDVTTISGGATDQVGLAAFAWVPVGIDCTPVAPIVERIVSIPGRDQGNLHVVVVDDHSPGGGLRLTYDRDPCSGVPDCMCYPDTPAGDGGEWAECMTDCSCAAGLSCIGYFGLAGPMWNCVRICSDFMDCNPGETCLPPILDGAPYVCSREGDLCEDDVDCPAGFTCTHTSLASFCEDARTEPTGLPCACDDQCPAGHICIDPGDGPVCEIPCLSDTWCPETTPMPPECTDRFICDHP